MCTVSPFGGSNVIWLLVLGSGAIANLAYCGLLLSRGRTWSNSWQPHTAHRYALAILVGLLWGGGIFMYGAAAPKLGKLGPVIGWPLSLVVSLVTANSVGYMLGEWRFGSQGARRGMRAGLAILLVAIGMLGWSSRLGS
jgi:L-rhamnose-H+ transport protein